jgi:hypothetical protein
VQKTPDFLNFTTKVRYLYDAIGATFSEDVSYPWVNYLFAGLDAVQVRDLTARTIAWQASQPIAKVTWTSPDAVALPGQLAGQVTVTWKNGLRTLPEQQDLYGKLRAAGFEVWICSASFVDVIREISSNPAFGYGNPEDHVLAMELDRTPAGLILPVFRPGYDQTQGAGKTATIRRFLAGPNGRYRYDPSFIAGDSEGDQNMLNDFPGLRLGLIINRNKGKGNLLGTEVQAAIAGYHQPDPKYLLQGRDDNLGQFTPDQLFIKFGGSTGVLLP